MGNYMKKIVITVTLPRSLLYKPSRDKRSADSGNAPRLYDPAVTLDATRAKRQADEVVEVSDFVSNAASRISAASPRVKRATSDDWEGESDEGLHYHQLAGDLLEDLARKLGWGSLEILWFAYGHYDDAGQLKVDIFLADETLTPSAVNLTRIVERAAAAYREGELILNAGGTELPGGEMTGCEDQDCQQTFLRVTAPSAAPALEAKRLAVGVSAAAAVLLVRAVLSG